MITNFETWAKPHRVSLQTMFPTLRFGEIAVPDMSLHANFFGKDLEHEDLKAAQKRIDSFQKKHPNALLANGYLEERSFYNTENYRRAGAEPRNIHLGTDFWVPAGTPLHAPFNAEVTIANDNNFHKDYGPTLVLKHAFKDYEFFSLYGHLSKPSLEISFKNKAVKQGELIGYIGTEEENGHWVPHLHFQLITNLLDNTTNFNGTAKKTEIDYWKQICPNPDFIFKEQLPAAKNSIFNV